MNAGKIKLNPVGRGGFAAGARRPGIRQKTAGPVARTGGNRGGRLMPLVPCHGALICFRTASGTEKLTSRRDEYERHQNRVEPAARTDRGR
jgi:hypothetical protein